MVRQPKQRCRLLSPILFGKKDGQVDQDLQLHRHDSSLRGNLQRLSQAGLGPYIVPQGAGGISEIVQARDDGPLVLDVACNR